MGNCRSQTEEERKSQLDNQKLDHVLVQKQEEDKRVVKLLLLGTGESGKSTIFKQMQILHEEHGFSDHEKTTFRSVVRRNVIEAMQVLLFGVDKFRLTLKNQESIVAAKFLTGLDPLAMDLVWHDDIVVHIRYLWANEPAIKEAYENRSKLQLIDSAQYLFENIERFGRSDYIPKSEDILRARFRTSGIVERTFRINNVNFRFLDVGGQRNERRKWIHCFEGVTAVFFVAAISEYDQTLYEDEKENRLFEAIKVFDNIINNRYFITSTIILFMNKIDIFQEKVARVHLNVCFTEYDGDNSYNDASEYIKARFLEKSKDLNRFIFAHLTCATDTQNVARVFDACKITILNQNLQKLGLSI